MLISKRTFPSDNLTTELDIRRAEEYPARALSLSHIARSLPNTPVSTKHPFNCYLGATTDDRTSDHKLRHWGRLDGSGLGPSRRSSFRARAFTVQGRPWSPPSTGRSCFTSKRHLRPSPLSKSGSSRGDKSDGAAASRKISDPNILGAQHRR